MDYSKLIQIIPSYTKEYLDTLLSFLLDGKVVTYNSKGYKDFAIKKDDDRLLYKALCSFLKLNSNSYSLLVNNGFNESIANNYKMINDQNDLNYILQKYYYTMIGTDDIKKLLILTPEEILSNIMMYHNKSTNIELLAGKLINSLSYFYDDLDESKEKLEEKFINDLCNNTYKDFSSSLINYLETTARIYKYLYRCKSNINNISTDKDNIIALSYLIALNYYTDVNDDGIDAKTIILDHLKELGIKIPEIENKIGIHSGIAPRSKDDILTIIDDLYYDIIKNIPKDKLNVQNVFYQLINSDKNVGFKKVFSLYNQSINNVSKINEKFNNKLDIKESETKIRIDNLFNGLMPNTIKVLHRVNQIYTYILSISNNIDKSYIESNSDLVILSFIICGYENEYDKYLYHIYRGLTLEKILELLNMPNKEKLFEEIDKTNEIEEKIIDFELYISNTSCGNKSNVDEKLLFYNTLKERVSNSKLFRKLYYTVTNESLPTEKTVLDFLDVYYKKVDILKKEDLFKNVNIEVYNYLEIVTTLYDSFLDDFINTEDKQQLSIILGIGIYSNDIKEFLKSKYNLDLDKLKSFYEVNTNINKNEELNISVITDALNKYIFDRDNDKISIFTIFENAFKEELGNSIKLRQALYEMGLKPEDIKNTEENYNNYKIEKQEEERTNNILKLLNKYDINSSLNLDNLLKIYEYLKNNNINNPKELSSLLEILYEDSVRLKYYNQNNITLEYVLSLYNLNINDFNNAINSIPNRDLILDFEDYFSKAFKVNNEVFFNLLNKNVYELLRSIIFSLNEDYDTVIDRIKNKKEKELTVEEAIKLLEDEEIKPLSDSNITTLANYGTNISNHSKYIHNALNELINSDSLEKSINDINNSINNVIVEKEEPRKQSFLSSLFYEEPPTIKRTYDISKLDEVGPSIDNSLINLNNELRGYEYIKKYIELYLLKLESQLVELKKLYDSIPEYDNKNIDDVSSYTKYLNNKTTKEIIYGKITNIETIIVLMKQELFTVHTSIINHFTTINSLYTSKNAILPLIASEIAINIGNKSEKEALELTNNLISLFQGVVYKNVDLTKQNLEKLKSSSIPLDTLNKLNTDIDLYINDINRTNELLDNNKPKELIKKETY